MHSNESRLVTGPSDRLFAGVYACTFRPGNFTGWGSERVKLVQRRVVSEEVLLGTEIPGGE